MKRRIANITAVAALAALAGVALWQLSRPAEERSIDDATTGFTAAEGRSGGNETGTSTIETKPFDRPAANPDTEARGAEPDWLSSSSLNPLAAYSSIDFHKSASFLSRRISPSLAS